MSTTEKLKEKMQAYAAEHPEVEELFKEIWPVIDNPLWFFCENEAYYQLNNFGVVNPTEERIEALQRRLFNSEGFVNGEVAYNITDNELYENKVTLSELMKDGEELREVELSTGRKFQYIASPDNSIIEDLWEEHSRLLDIYYQHSRFVNIMGIDLSPVYNNGEDFCVDNCPYSGFEKLSDCRTKCDEYKTCNYAATVEAFKREYEELAAK